MRLQVKHKGNISLLDTRVSVRARYDHARRVTKGTVYLKKRVELGPHTALNAKVELHQRMPSGGDKVDQRGADGEVQARLELSHVALNATSSQGTQTRRRAGWSGQIALQSPLVLTADSLSLPSASLPTRVQTSASGWAWTCSTTWRMVRYAGPSTHASRPCPPAPLVTPTWPPTPGPGEPPDREGGHQGAVECRIRPVGCCCAAVAAPVWTQVRIIEPFSHAYRVCQSVVSTRPRPSTLTLWAA